MTIKDAALPLEDEADLDPLLTRIGDARYVLIGEASHGTHEFYAWRAALTRRLIEEHGFSFVAVEGDWPDCYEVNRSVTLADGAPEDPAQVLNGFDRWPTWMWANQDVVDFTRWLRDHNTQRHPEGRIGFYGLDVYSLWDSLRATLNYLQAHQPEHVETALEAFRCFEPYAEDPQSYARSTRLVPSGCEPEVVKLLTQLRSDAPTQSGTNRNARFNAEQNARAAAGAEAYYRAMVAGGPDSWNIRDTHMLETLQNLMNHHGPDAKCVVWEHNTHIGDARWTDMSEAGMVNVGQLVREQHSEDGVVLIGFGSYQGKVLAADYWGGEVEAMTMPPAREGSTEEAIHRTLGQRSALFVFKGDEESWASQSRDHRAIGVVYTPHAERWGNYVPTVLDRRYDVFLWIDETTALTSLHGMEPAGGELQTWPTGDEEPVP
ncbi:Erythromycin esterase homolog [Arthrobacter subterraneus]|uniref:Erythromycin esterase homolog n=1 Tax=Arthrobacter subterraneus TaxID=335973 RepID=A0A1G8Q801_9MICC|nr:erythromycin esterase family protein [Arthrobacter subterraneus]SDJ00605.1 Erythromycin esterase homolog [Arthrobacter subterraneus]